MSMALNLSQLFDKKYLFLCDPCFPVFFWDHSKSTFAQNCRFFTPPLLPNHRFHCLRRQYFKSLLREKKLLEF